MLIYLGMAVLVAACSAPAPPLPEANGSCASGAARAADTPVVAFTATSNEPAPTLPAELRNRLKARADDGRAVCLAVVTPQRELRIFDVTARRTNGQVENGPAKARRVAENLARVDQQVARVTAGEPGLDPLAVIDAAARLHPAPAEVWVVTSGVTTVAPTNLLELGWDLDAHGEAQRLAALGALPDLRGRQVTFAGIGDVAGDQPTLTIALRQRLQAWWLEICRAAHAAGCRVDGELLSVNASYSRNRVPVVPLPRPVLRKQRYTLPNALLFPLASAQLDANADSGLGQVVDRVTQSGERIRIDGHTDAVTGTAVGNQLLSEQRAQAVADRLLRLGLPADRIAGVEGAGSRSVDVRLERSDPGQVARDRNVQITFEPAGRSS